MFLVSILHWRLDSWMDRYHAESIRLGIFTRTWWNLKSDEWGKGYASMFYTPNCVDTLNVWVDNWLVLLSINILPVLICNWFCLDQNEWHESWGDSGLGQRLKTRTLRIIVDKTWYETMEPIVPVDSILSLVPPTPWSAEHQSRVQTSFPQIRIDLTQ